MLYFIKSQNYLKIGYTKDADTYNRRIKDYRTHNPEMEIIEVTLEGSLKDEKTLHSLLKKFQYRAEWFYENSEIYKIWKNYTKDIQKVSKFYNEVFIKDSKEITSSKQYIIQNSNSSKLNDIIKDVYEEFGEECILTGEEIRSKLSEIYSKNGAYFYPDTKTLAKFGYSMIRKRVNGIMTYFIEKRRDFEN